MLQLRHTVGALSVLLYFGLVSYIQSINVDIRLVTGAKEKYFNIPSGFSIGTGTSSYQIEGAWNASDKGESLWDWYTHTHPDRISDRSNGDVACDSYHKFKEDVRLLRMSGMEHYRFSISWPRLLPTGYANVVSEDGLRYYNELIDELLKYNIKPMVTLYHWDHPQVFQEMGGWTNEIMVELFANYARIVFREFGDRVKIFSTINEPDSVCQRTYFTGMLAPGVILGKHAEYLCNHNVLKAHARAYHIYDKEFRPQQKGQIGIVLNLRGFFSKYPKDKVSNEIAFQFNCGMYAHPIYSKQGDYPTVVKERVAKNSQFEKLPSSRLPTFSKDWVDYIKGTADYMGINYYTSQLVEPAPKSNRTIYENDHGLMYSFDERWESTLNGLRIVPEGLLALLSKVTEEYDNPPIYITENGIPDRGTLEDNKRMEFLYSHIESTLLAMNAVGTDIRGYTIWSLIDNFEWNQGYSPKFGIFNVDFKSQNRNRKPKYSAFWLKDVIKARKLLPVPKLRKIENSKM